MIKMGQIQLKFEMNDMVFTKYRQIKLHYFLLTLEINWKDVLLEKYIISYKGKSMWIWAKKLKKSHSCDQIMNLAAKVLILEL